MAQVFTRGQIWFYEDPTYGKKEKEIAIPRLEARTSYSRYVVILQDTTEFSGDWILVGMCTSSGTHPHDVEVRLLNSMVHPTTFVRTSTITPVNVRTLEKYICTLSKGDIKRIDKMIKSLLFGKAKPQQNVYSDWGITDEKPVVLKYEYKKIHDPSEIIAKPGVCKPIQGSPINEVPINRTSNGCIKWTPELKQQFMNDRYNNGIEYCMEKYALNRQGIHTRTCRCRKDGYTPTQQIESNEKPSVQENKAAPITGSSRAPTKFDFVSAVKASEISTQYTISSVSDISNRIVRELKERQLYEDINSNLSQKTFYSKISSAIYFGILDFLWIKKAPQGFDIPTLTDNMPNLATYYFLDQYAKDPNIISIYPITAMIRIFRNNNKHISKSMGIQLESMEDIGRRILNAFRTTDVKVTKVTMAISKIIS